MLSRELLTQRTLAAEEALHSLRRSLPLLKADDQGVLLSAEDQGVGGGRGLYLSKSQLAGSIQHVIQGPEETDLERRAAGYAGGEEGVLGSGLASRPPQCL